MNILNNNKVYVIQEIPGTVTGTPKINIMGAAQYWPFIYDTL